MRELLASLNQAGVPCGPIYKMNEVFDDPQVRHLGLATPVPRVDVGADGRLVSRRYGNAANTIYDGDYRLFSAFATVRLGTRAVVTGRVRNLTDAVYAASVTGTPMFFLGAPRSADVTVRVTF